MKTGGEVLGQLRDRALDSYRICLRFDDGTQQDIDFERFLSRSLQPDIRAYLDPVRFGSFRLEYGELVWGDYDLCFPIEDLYCNRIERPGLVEFAA